MKFQKPDNFIYLLLLSFVFLTSSALAQVPQSAIQKFSLKVALPKIFSPAPKLVGSTPFPILSAESALAVDVDSKIILYEKNPDTPLLPASTTKIVTALVAMDYYPDEAEVTVGKLSVDGQKMGLVHGEKIRARDLLYGLLVFSANDAAEVLAQNYNGGRDAFIAAMNSKVKELGLTKSEFSNPTGLDGSSYVVSTARDLIIISEVAMKNPRFAKIVATREITVKSEDGRIVHKLININELLGKVEGVMGVKTGWTQNAKENLVTYIERDGRKVMIAVLGSQDRFGETKELIDWIFANYKWEEVFSYSP